MRVNMSELASVFGVSTQAVQAWVRRGCPFVEKGGAGKAYVFETADVITWRREIEMQATGDGDDDSITLEQARKRRELAQARLSEIDLAKRRSELVEIEAVAEIVSEDYTRVRARLLALPPKCAPLIHKAETVTEIREILDGSVREALAELSSEVSGEPEAVGQGQEVEEAQAAAETSSQ